MSILNGSYDSYSYYMDSCITDSSVSTTFLRITTAIYGILFILGTIGNVLVITVIYKHREMRSSTNYFLINLSLADLLVLLICMPVGLSEMYLGSYFPFGKIMCYVVQISDYAAPQASILTLLSVAAERYFAICTPFKAQYMFTARRTLAVCIATWVISIAACIPAIDTIEYSECVSPEGMKPTCIALVSSEGQEMYVLMVNVIFFAVPCAVLSVIYFLIGKALRSHDVLMASVSHQGSSRSNSDAESKTDGLTNKCRIAKFVSCMPCIKKSPTCEGQHLYFQIPPQKKKLERSSMNGDVANSRLNGCDYIAEVATMSPNQLSSFPGQTPMRELPTIREEDGEYYPLQQPTDRTCGVSSVRSSPLPAGRTTAKRRSHSKLIVMLGTVVVVFFICWLPMRVMALWQIFVSTEAFNKVNFDTLMFLILCSRLLVYINSSINPLLYNLISSKFRRAFKYTVSCREMPSKPGFSKPPSSSSFAATGRGK